MINKNYDLINPVMKYIFKFFKNFVIFFLITSNKQERALITNALTLNLILLKYNLWKTLRLFKKVAKNKRIKYNFVECGVWKGIYLVFSKTH